MNGIHDFARMHLIQAEYMCTTTQSVNITLPMYLVQLEIIEGVLIYWFKVKQKLVTSEVIVKNQWGLFCPSLYSIFTFEL